MRFDCFRLRLGGAAEAARRLSLPRTCRESRIGLGAKTQPVHGPDVRHGDAAACELRGTTVVAVLPAHGLANRGPTASELSWKARLGPPTSMTARAVTPIGKTSPRLITAARVAAPVHSSMESLLALVSVGLTVMPRSAPAVGPRRRRYALHVSGRHIPPRRHVSIEVRDPRLGWLPARCRKPAPGARQWA